jgi:hypothetical protein
MSDNSKKSRENQGYSYEIVGHCRRCGKPFLRPFWSHKQHDLPIHPSCLCARAIR